MNIALYEKFNALPDKKRFDIVQSINQRTPLKKAISLRNPKGTEILALQVDANWEWGVSGAGKPHPHMNVIGTVAEKTFRDKLVWGWTPFGERYGISHVSLRNYLVIEDVKTFEASLESAMNEVDSSMVQESAIIKRWGKLAGLLKD